MGGGQIFEHHATEGQTEINCMNDMESNPKRCTHLLGPIASKNILETDRAAHAASLGASKPHLLGLIASKNILEGDRAAHAATLGAEEPGSTEQCVYTVHIAVNQFPSTVHLLPLRHIQQTALYTQHGCVLVQVTVCAMLSLTSFP